MRSSTSYENQSRPKQRERKRLETSSILFHGQKLRSRTSATLSLILNGAVSASLISPSSFGLFGMQVQHQTSTHAGNILSSYGNPCKLDPVQLCGTCLCLPKCKAKEHGHCQKKTRLLTTIWQRKDVWKTLFQNKSSGTINPVHLPQTTPEKNKEGVNKDTLSISNLAQYFILQLWRNIPLTTMTSIELRLLNTCCITQKVRC